MSTSEGGSFRQVIQGIVLGVAGTGLLFCCIGLEWLIGIPPISQWGRSTGSTFSAVASTKSTDPAEKLMVPAGSPEDAAREFLGYLWSVDIDNAYARSTTAAYRAANKKSDLEFLRRHNDGMTRIRLSDLKTQRHSATHATVTGQFENDRVRNGPMRTATLALRVEDGQWKVDRFTLD